MSIPTFEPEVEAEALKVLADVQGDAAIGELDARIEHVAMVTDGIIGAYHGNPKGYGGGIGGALRDVRDAIAARRVYESRKAALLKLDNPKSAARVKGAVVAAVEEAYKLLVSAPGVAQALKRETDQAAAKLRQELVSAETDITHARMVAGNPGFNVSDYAMKDLRYRAASFGGRPNRHDPTFCGLARAIGRRNAIRRQLDILERNEARRTTVQGDLVKGVVDGDGGAAILLKNLRYAALSQATLYEGDAGMYPELRELTTKLDGMEAHLKRLGDGPHDPESLGGVLESESATIRAKIADLKAAIRGNWAADTEHTIERATSGDEQARGEIEAIARTTPEAFRPGFADRLAAARYELAGADALIFALDLEDERVAEAKRRRDAREANQGRTEATTQSHALADAAAGLNATSATETAEILSAFTK